MRIVTLLVKRGFLCIVFCCIATICAAATDAQKPFFLVEDPWPPYTKGEPGAAPDDGLIVKVMEELFKRIGQPLRMELLPWKRCIYMVQNRKADGLMLTVKTSKREKYAYFPEPFFVNKINFYHRAGKEFSWENFSDLRGLTIGVVAGAKYSQEFQDAIVEYGLQTEVVNSIVINFNKLKADRIDITPVLDVVARKIIEDDHAFHNQFLPAAKPLRTTAMQMAIARSSALMDHVDTINQAIIDMKIDGTVQLIYAEYVPELHTHLFGKKGKCLLDH